MSHPDLTTWRHESLQLSSLCSSETINHFTYSLFCNSLGPQTCFPHVVPSLHLLGLQHIQFPIMSANASAHFPYFALTDCLNTVNIAGTSARTGNPRAFKFLKAWYFWMQQSSKHVFIMTVTTQKLTALFRNTNVTAFFFLLMLVYI